MKCLVSPIGEHVLATSFLCWHSSPCNVLFYHLNAVPTAMFFVVVLSTLQNSVWIFTELYPHETLSQWVKRMFDMHCKLAQAFLSSLFWVSRQSILQVLRLWVRIMQTHKKFYSHWGSISALSYRTPHDKVAPIGSGREALTTYYVSGLYPPTLCQPCCVEHLSRWIVDRVGYRKFWGCG